MLNKIPLIGILGESSPPSPNSAFQNFRRQGCVDTYTSIFEKLNTNAIIIPSLSNYNQDIIEKYISTIDGLMLIGGADITPDLYNEERVKECGKTNITHDKYTIDLILEAYKQNKSILGICRGAQIINVAFSGSLYQDLKYDNRENKDKNHLDLNNIDTPSHKIIINKDSKLYTLFNKQILDVNSLHHQSINQVGNNLRLSAISEDGLVEAIESDEDNRFILGLQWHPETLFSKSDEMKPIFESFIQSTT
ncbi:MAG: gamma-glutamyl-gamma-aminobutyrate hydrolase family protein [Pleomorphochaeta sp.]